MLPIAAVAFGMTAFGIVLHLVETVPAPEQPSPAMAFERARGVIRVSGHRVERRKVMTGRRMVRSATSANIIASVTSHPNSRNDGRLEKTVTTIPQASTIDVRISAGPIRTVARRTAMSIFSPNRASSLSRFRK